MKLKKSVLPDCQVQYQALIHDSCFWAWTFLFSPKDSQLMHQHLQLAVKYNQITETYSHYTTAVVWQMHLTVAWWFAVFPATCCMLPPQAWTFSWWWLRIFVFFDTTCLVAIYWQTILPKCLWISNRSHEFMFQKTVGLPIMEAKQK